MNDVNNVTIPFQHPFMLTLCGPSQSGKTYWLVKLFTHIESMIKPTPDKIIYLYTSYQQLYNEMTEIIKKKHIAIDFIDCNKGIPLISDIQKDTTVNTLIILDDLMTVAASNNENMLRLDNLACHDVHHCNVSVVFVCQNLMYGNGKLRNSRVNSQYHVLFANLADHRNLYTLAENKKIKHSTFKTILDEIHKEPFSYLLFDNCNKGIDNTRLRRNIFPGESTYIYDV